jgi:acyl-CoA dehydrogenase
VRGSAGVIVHLQNTYPRLADEETQRAVAAGRALVTFADREPGTFGPVPDRIQTTARKDGSDWVLSGRKSSVPLLPGASHVIVTALTDEQRGYFAGTSLFLVDTKAHGVSIEPTRMKGLRAVHLGHLQLDNVRVGPEQLLGEQDRGFRAVQALWPLTRGMRLFWDIASAMRALEFMVEDTKQKSTFGRPLLKWQAIQFKLSDAQTNLAPIRTMVQYLAWALDQGLSVTEPGISPRAYASMVHLLFSEFGNKAFEDVLELGSGRAFREDHEVWQRYMDHLMLRFWDGPEELDRRVLAGEVFEPNWAYAALPGTAS